MESKLEWSTYNGRREMESKKILLVYCLWSMMSMPWKRILFLTGGMAEWQTRLASMANLVQETGFNSHVDQI